MLDKQQILVVDDDAGFCGMLAETVENHGPFTVTTAYTLEEADNRRDERDAAFDAFILDIGLPDGDGRSYCASLRKQGVQTPILMLTGLDAEADVVQSLSAGANDYVAKPFRIAVLMARLRSQLRSFESSVHLQISIGPYTFQPGKKVLSDLHRRKRIVLTDKETKILRFLCRTPGEAVTRETLLSEVWGHNNQVGTHTLETHIYRLRQKMEVEPGMPRLIRSRPPGCYSIHLEAGLVA